MTATANNQTPNAYSWAAELENGSIVTEYDRGQQRSVEVLRSLRVVRLSLLPSAPGPCVTLEIDPDHETWIKHWTRERRFVLNGAVEDRTWEVLGLTGAGGATVYVHLTADEMVITSRREP